MPRAALPASIYFMAAAGGFAAANLHYSQPLLPAIAADMGTRIDGVALLPAVTQGGFALGILTILPLSDVLERRRIVLCCLAAVTLALFWHAHAQTVGSLYTAAFFVGLAGVVPQLLTPFASLIAPEGRAGEASGMVLSGILTGVLLSKVLSGLVAETFGWRVLFTFAACLMLVLLLACWRILPQSRPELRESYASVLRSMGQLLRSEPRLSLHALNGGLTFAAFMTFWATYAIYLFQSRGYGPGIAGLFGLAGMAGAVAASFTGRLVDGGRFARAQIIACLCMSGGLILAMAAGVSLIFMVLGLLLLDLGAGMSHAANQAKAFRLRLDARGRINGIYMAGYFIGGAGGTALATLVLVQHGWIAACLLGALFGAAPLLTLPMTRRVDSPAFPDRLFR